MLATGVRIGEALAVVWSQVDFEAGTVQITSTLVRVKGEGLLRKGTKSRAGERTLPLPVSAVAMLRRRFMTGARLDQPLFPDVLGGFRDPANVRRELREARGDGDAGVDHLAHASGRRPRRSSTRPRCRLAWSPTSSGTARPSMTQDVYLGRRAVDSQAARRARGRVKGRVAADRKAMAKLWAKKKARTRDGGPDLRFCAPSGTRTPNPLIKSQLLCQLS